MVGILERVTDEFGKVTWQPQMEGSKAARELPDIRSSRFGAASAFACCLRQHQGSGDYGRPNGRGVRAEARCGRQLSLRRTWLTPTRQPTRFQSAPRLRAAAFFPWLSVEISGTKFRWPGTILFWHIQVTLLVLSWPKKRTSHQDVSWALPVVAPDVLTKSPGQF